MKISNAVSPARFARSAREAFGTPIYFERRKNPDRVVGWVCAVGVVVMTYLVLTGVA